MSAWRFGYGFTAGLNVRRIANLTVFVWM